MTEILKPTPFGDINAVLQDLHARIQATLGDQLVGIYVIGSIALAAFDRHTSDIDLIVVTRANPNDAAFQALAGLHEQFATSRAPWGGKIEAVYVPPAALRAAPPPAEYPQIEHGGPLFRAPLEDGWIFQRYLLREHGIAIAGPDPRRLADPIRREEMRPAVATIAGTWLEQARDDPDWRAWLRERESQVFVILTLCRMLYSLETGAVAAKPAAAKWARQALGEPWAGHIARTLAARRERAEVPQDELELTIGLVSYTVERSRRNAA
jgi:hypothetical protein